MVSKFRRIQRSKSISVADRNICLFGNELYARFYERQLVSVGQLIKSIAKNEFSTHTVRCVCALCFEWTMDSLCSHFTKECVAHKKGFFSTGSFVCLFVCSCACSHSFISLFFFLFCVPSFMLLLRYILQNMLLTCCLPA